MYICCGVPTEGLGTIADGDRGMERRRRLAVTVPVYARPPARPPCSDRRTEYRLVKSAAACGIIEPGIQNVGFFSTETLQWSEGFCIAQGRQGTLSEGYVYARTGRCEGIGTR